MRIHSSYPNSYQVPYDNDIYVLRQLIEVLAASFTTVTKKYCKKSPTKNVTVKNGPLRPKGHAPF